jgi:hypothetical protein
MRRDRVEAVVAERVAARQPPKTEPDALHRAMGADGLGHIVSARGLKSATSREQR